VVYSPNYPPSEPDNPSPGNGATNVDLNVTLSWTCSDPDGDPLTYDVYFGNSSPPPMVLGSYTNTTWSPGPLDMGIKYYWQIVAWDNHSNSKEGPIWSFTTLLPPNTPPNAPFIDGPQWAVTGQEYSFIVQSSDPDGDDVRYTITWGDSTEDTTEFVPQNTPVTINHTWNIVYPLMILRVTVTAEDIHGAVSSLTEKWVIISWIKSVQINTQLIYSQKINLKIMNTNT
jgi:hypothetical protein